MRQGLRHEDSDQINDFIEHFIIIASGLVTNILNQQN